MTAQPPRRVRITSPRRDAARSRPARPATREIDEQTGVGLVYLATLLRTQRRLATGVLGALLVLLVGLPLGVRLLPRPGPEDTGWIVATWLALGVLSYPVMWLAARMFVRASTRLDEQFASATRLDDDEPTR